MRRWACCIVGPKFSRGETIWSPTIPNEHRLARPEFGETAASQCFRMHENVGRLWTVCQKAKPAYTIEPLHHDSFPFALGNHNNMGALGQLRWTDCRGVVHAGDADGLQTLGTLRDFARNTSLNDFQASWQIGHRRRITSEGSAEKAPVATPRRRSVKRTSC